MNFKLININSFEQFFSVINANKQDDLISLFRGQKDDLPLFSKLYRDALKFKRVNEIYAIERNIINNFKKTLSPNLLNKKTLNDWDCLTIAQHYGLPTRFLDWSQNPLIALWFAFQSEKKNSKNRVVWGMLIDADSYVDFDKDSPFNQRFVKVFKPNFVDIRVSVQDSWFSVQDIQFFGNGGDGLPHLHANHSIEESEEFEYDLAKFVFPNNLRSEVLQKLQLLGISQTSIYPNLTKECKKIWLEEFKK